MTLVRARIENAAVAYYEAIDEATAARRRIREAERAEDRAVERAREAKDAAIAAIAREVLAGGPSAPAYLAYKDAWGHDADVNLVLEKVEELRGRSR